MLASRHALCSPPPTARVSSSFFVEVWFCSVFRDLSILFPFLGSSTVAPQFSKHFPSCLSQVTILAPCSCYGAVHSHLSSWKDASCPVPHQLPTPAALWSARHFHPPGFVAHSSLFRISCGYHSQPKNCSACTQFWNVLAGSWHKTPPLFFLIHSIATRCLSIWWSSYTNFWEWDVLRF